MVNKTGDAFKSYWKFIVFALAPLAIIAIVFALPLKTVPVQATEKYWATETQQQPYTVTETYVDQEPYTATETKTETIYNDTTYIANWTRTFTIDKPQSTVTITMQNFGGYSYSYPPIWYTPAPDPDSHIFRYFPYDYGWGGSGMAKITIDVSYPQEITKTRSVTKTRDVVKYRDVQVQVQKERSVTSYVKKSLWSYLFD